MNHFGLMLEWRLSVGEASILFCLHGADGAVVPVDQVQHAASRGLHKSADLCRVMMVRLRRKVAPLGVEIETIHGQGYALTRAAADLITEKLASIPNQFLPSNLQQAQGV